MGDGGSSGQRAARAKDIICDQGHPLRVRWRNHTVRIGRSNWTASNRTERIMLVISHLTPAIFAPASGITIVESDDKQPWN
jgi:hypothetical protein